MNAQMMSLFCLVLMAASLWAAPSNYYIKKLPAGTTVTLDGDMSKWPQAYFIDSIAGNLNVYASDDPTWTRTDFQMHVWAAWDDNNVYYAVKVVSDNIYGLCGGPGYTCGCDNIKINPGGSAAAFYLYSSGALFRNPSNPWNIGTDLHSGVNSHGGENGLPAYEFSISRSVIDQFDLRNFQLSVGTEDEDGGQGSCSNECAMAIGAEYTGSKTQWNSQWDNPLYYPTYRLDTIAGPSLNPPMGFTTIPIPGPTSNRKPLFQWHRFTDSSSYTLQIDTQGTFVSPVISIPTADTFFLPLANLPFGTIYWKVISDKPARTSNMSSFILQDSTVPVLIPYVPNPTQEKRPILRWHRVNGATGYQIQIAHDSTFNTLNVSAPVVDTFFTPLSNLAPGTVYWRVNSSLSAKYSPSSSLYIQPDTIPLPYAFNGSTVSTRRPLFRWKPVARATSYRIQIDSSRSFAAPVASLDVSDTSFTPLANLNNRKYYWHVSCNLNSAVYSQLDSVNVLVTAIEAEQDVVSETDSLKVSPNPFNPMATIRFPNNAHDAAISIMDINGKVVSRFEHLRGNQVTWNAEKEPSGVYFVKVAAGRQNWTCRVFLMK